MHKIISEWHIGKYTVLELDQKLPTESYRGYRIDGTEYNPVPVYDFPNHIAVEAKVNLVGKTVEFI